MEKIQKKMSLQKMDPKKMDLKKMNPKKVAFGQCLLHQQKRRNQHQPLKKEKLILLVTRGVRKEVDPAQRNLQGLCLGQAVPALLLIEY